MIFIYLIFKKHYKTNKKLIYNDNNNDNSKKGQSHQYALIVASFKYHKETP